MLSRRCFGWICCLLSALLLGCIELAPPPPAPDFPTVPASQFLTMGIEPNLASLQSIIQDRSDLTENPAVVINGSPSDLINQVKSGELDAAFVYQKPADSNLWTLPVALDSVSILAHPDVNVQAITRPELQQIFSGSVSTWQSFTGQDQAISVFVLDSDSGINHLFNARVMENRPFGVSAVIVPNSDAMISAVDQTPASIGFLPASLLNDSTNLAQLPIDGVFPQFNTVRNQTYPLTIPVYLVAAEEPQGALRALAAWLQSAEGQQVLSQSFVQLGAN
ncbi:MAG: substrate-binding domain-containing protein [Chloroflexota bacterium]